MVHGPSHPLVCEFQQSGWKAQGSARRESSKTSSTILSTEPPIFETLANDSICNDCPPGLVAADWILFFLDLKVKVVKVGGPQRKQFGSNAWTPDPRSKQHSALVHPDGCLALKIPTTEVGCCKIQLIHLLYQVWYLAFQHFPTGFPDPSCKLHVLELTSPGELSVQQRMEAKWLRTTSRPD